MSKKRGLSADEKRIRMLEIFHQSKDFFQLKELEKIAPKEKGITMQSVKEVIQSLVDDHLVDTEKIGTSIYFWSFPSKAKTAMKRKLQDLQNELSDTSKKLKITEDSIAAESFGREEGDSRKVTLAELEEVNKQESDLKKELQKYRDCDPEYISQLKTEIDDLKSAVNRWTENIYILKSYIKNTFQMDNDIIDQNFNIPSDMDYIEELHAEVKNGRCHPFINVTDLDVACTEETVSAVSDLGVYINKNINWLIFISNGTKGVSKDYPVSDH